ncbi:MAG: SUMF1/EgtB/PvdO family nonheme iron enzyme [Chlorobium sp.]
MKTKRKAKLLSTLCLDKAESMEFLEAIDENAIGQTVCGFLNSSGGYIIVGVSETSEVSALSPEQDFLSLEQAIRIKVLPQAMFSFETQILEENKLVLVIEVPSGKDFPYSYNGRFFVREKDQTQPAPVDIIRDMIMRRQIEPERWERRFSDVNLQNELDLKEIERTVEGSVKAGKDSLLADKTMSSVQVLERLGMIKYGRITNGGDVLFTQHPAIRHPQVTVRAVYAKSETDDNYIDHKNFEGPLYRVLLQTHDFILRNTSTRSVFYPSDLKRKDECIYPAFAIREALINAFAHRDYANFGGGIVVKIFQDRLKIWNSGNFLQGITRESVASGNLSVLRNPDISMVLYLQGLMERTGRGGRMIVDACKERGLPYPLWDDTPGQGVTLTFFAPEGPASIADRYKAMLKEELGYIRMLGMPGIERVVVNLNDYTFVPLRLSDRQESGFYSVEEHIHYPDEVMKRAFSRRRMLLVIGDPGAGKTTLLKYYALCALDDDHYKRLGFSKPVSVFFLPLRELARRETGYYTSLPESLALWTKKHQIALSAQIFDEWLQVGTSLVLLDGLDEICDTEERIKVCRWIDMACSAFPKAYFVVTSRATGYRKDEGIELAADYERADVQDFTVEQQERFLRNWFSAAFLKEPCDDGNNEVEWQRWQMAKADERTRRIVAYLQEEKNRGLRQLASIPMILQIMAILWKERDYIPESRVKLYEAALDYMLEFRDKRRYIMPLISATRARLVLGPIALWMQEEEKKDEVDRAKMHKKMQERLDTMDNPPSAKEFCRNMVERAGLLVESGDKSYIFRHKSFREYLAGVELFRKVYKSPDSLSNLILSFGNDWWEEPIRFFMAQVDEEIFNLFMKKLFDSSVSEQLNQKQRLLLQTIIEEAPLKKVDALCNKLLDPATTASRQRVILDCLKAIGKPASLDALKEFRRKKLAMSDDVASRSEEVIFALGGEPLPLNAEKSVSWKLASFRNPNENNAEYILIPGGSYSYSLTKKKEHVADLYFAKYPVTNKLYRSFIASLQVDDRAFSKELNAIAGSNRWGGGFGAYLKKEKHDLVALFRSKYDEDRKFCGDDQPVVCVSWYAARAYCLWLSMLEGDAERYRLPNEVEWEWAAGGRQGTTRNKVRSYPWPEEKGKPDTKLANYNSNLGATTPVGSYPEGSTPEGLYDMAGNVWEWMGDSFVNNEFTCSLRGGSWFNYHDALRCASRVSVEATYWVDHIGFRVICSP